MDKTKPKRGKPIQKIFMVDESENELIEQKFKESGMVSRRAFFLKAILEIPIYIIDQKPIREHTQEINKIGVNFNQLVKKLNSAPDITPADIEAIKTYMKAIHDSENKFIKRFISLRK